MSDLKAYVDKLFFKYQKSKATEDLKAEILANLEAKKEDLIASGIDERTATEKAKESIKSIDYLIDGNKKIYINQFKLESLQIALLYLVLAWVITIPMMIFHSLLSLNLKILLLIVVVGITYLIKNGRKAEEYTMAKQYVNVNRYNRLKSLSWIFCTVFIIVCVLVVTGVHFGSNLWFGRPVRINGPYQFALVLSNYLPPFFIIIIPIFIGRLSKLLEKYEVGEKDED